MTHYAVILAGGKGERLWPLSREKCPKQILPFVNDHSLLEDTLNRLATIVLEKDRFIVTMERQKNIIEQLCKNNINSLFIEPASRNTAPAILLSCLLLARQDPEAIVIFLPADSYIPNTQQFVKSISDAFQYCKDHDKIVLFGVKPTFPATGYGYIEFKEEAHDHVGSIIKFHEKPSQEVAEKYASMSSMLWNIGIFCGKISVFLQQFQNHVPDMYRSLQQYVRSPDQALYEALPSISIDYAVMEKTKDIVVMPVDFSWSDVGNLEVFLSLQKQYSRDNLDNRIEVKAHNNLIAADSKKLVTLLIRRMRFLS
jgi:mannose-1-phosphate guanylyltransferase